MLIAEDLPTGLHAEKDEPTSIGIVAHILPASVNGPRVENVKQQAGMSVNYLICSTYTNYTIKRVISV